MGSGFEEVEGIGGCEVTFLDVQVTYRLHGAHAQSARECIEDGDRTGLLELATTYGRRYVDHYDDVTRKVGRL